MSPNSRYAVLVGVALSCVLLPLLARPQSGTGPTLTIETKPLPNGAPHRPYKFEFHTTNGIPPMKWVIVDGDTPAGLRMNEDGVLSGNPIAAGLFHFTVQASDTSRPPLSAKRDVELRIVPPLLLEWKDSAKVTGSRVEGSVQVSNGTGDDFDFTIVMLAVAENGRATAIGYQRFLLKAGVTSFPVPFGENLPHGAYELHIDAIAEVPEKDAIYRARLQTKDKIQVAVGP